jgi:hypothetical protein
VLAPYRLRRTGATMLALALTASLAVASAATAGAQESAPQFTDLDQTVHGDAIRLVAEDGITTGYPDGTFRPRDDVRRDQMATFLARALELDPVTPTFPDVAPGPPHGDNIGAIAATDPPITTGYPDGTYRPMGYVTRGQLATFLAKGLDLPAGTSTFTDVPEGYVHAEAISALADADPPITQGYPDGTFRPNLLVKRDQMAAFLARGIPLPRQPDEPAPPVCPGSAGTSAASVTPERAPAASPTTQAAPATERDSEDLVELETGDVLAEASGRDAVTALAPDPDEAGYATASPTDLGPAIPGIDFPLTSVLRTASGQLEVLTQDLPTSRGARVDAAGDVTATTTIPAGRRSWATTRIGNTAYVGQWGVATGETNLFRFSTTASGNRVAQEVATVPTGNEFWGLTADDRGRLWAGTRAHAGGAFRQEVGLGDGRVDGRHVVHRVNPSSGQVTNVLFCQPSPATTSAGLRPDVKQVAAVGETLYVGTGQQASGARLYAFEPGDRTDVPLEDVRDLTPQNVRSHTGIFALRADERYVAFGTQAGAGQTARLVVLDRASGAVRVNLALSDESSRVDAVSIHGDRVVAAGFSGRVYDVAIPPAANMSPTVSSHLPPVPGQFHRYVERLEDGSLRGVTQRGVVWTRATDGEVDRVNLVDTGAPVAPGLPHGLHVGSADVAVGASSAVTLRDRVDLDANPRTLPISGEGKALTSNAAGDTFVATYPNAGLWRIEAGGDVAAQIGSWNATFLRPAAADFDDRSGRVHVIARNDNAATSDPRSSPQANLQFRPSRLFVMEPSPSSTVVPGLPLSRPPADPDIDPTDRPVEASSLLVGDEEGGTEAFVGDTFGGVQRVASDTGERTWYVPAREGDRDRPVVDISLVEDRLVVVHSGVLFARAGGTYDARTSIRELDPETGVELDYHRVAHPDVGREWAIPDAVTSGSVTVMASRSINRYYDRDRDDYWGVSHTYNYSFGGPYVELDEAGCALYSFVGDAPRPPDSFSNLRRSPVALGDCLPEPEEQPEDPQDPNDPGTEPGDPVDPDAG